jgi:hypothetical protein
MPRLSLLIGIIAALEGAALTNARLSCIIADKCTEEGLVVFGARAEHS